jgi:hypothetical protein
MKATYKAIRYTAACMEQLFAEWHSLILGCFLMFKVKYVLT